MPSSTRNKLKKISYRYSAEDDNSSSSEDDEYETESEIEQERRKKSYKKNNTGKKSGAANKKHKKKNNKSITMNNTETESDIENESRPRKKMRRGSDKKSNSRKQEDTSDSSEEQEDAKLYNKKRENSSSKKKKVRQPPSSDDSDDKTESTYIVTTSDDDEDCSDNRETEEDEYSSEMEDESGESGETEENSEDESKWETENESEENDVKRRSSRNSRKYSNNEPLYSIIITSTGKNPSNEYADYFGAGGDGDAEDLDMNLNKEEYTSEDERTFMKESYHNFSKNDNEPQDTKSDVKEIVKKNISKTKEKKPTSSAKDAQQEYKELIDLKKQLLENLERTPNNRILKKAIRDCNHSIKKLVKTTRIDNTKHYINLLQNGNSEKTSEIDFFKKKMSNREQLKIMDELTKINNHLNIDRPYRISLLEKQIPPLFKAIGLQKLDMLKNMNPGDNEYYKIKTWVDTFMRIPFGIYRSLNVSITDGKEQCHNFICNAKNILDECVFGLEEAKMQVLQMVGQWMANPNSMGTSIAIKGPPGTGKTSLIRDGISKIFGREFAFLALGGATDSSFLNGHSYTYEGSKWGRIVQILIDGKTMNPVIFFDELDKVSETPHGEEIIGVLTHMTDTTQNSQFHDKYFSELEFDLSKCLFAFSYNDENKINPILKDRMYVIHTKGYDIKEKLIIARNYLLPKIREQVNFKEEDIIVPDDVIQYIVSNQELTKNEEGVRNLKRCLEIIHTKLNLFRLVDSGTDLFKNNFDIGDVKFPITVTRKMVDQLIKNTDKTQNQSLLAMYV